jgi:hypothetical protein
MVITIIKHSMSEKYKSFLTKTKPFKKSTGSLKYSFEFENSQSFPFLGFDELKNNMENKIKSDFGVINANRELSSFKSVFENNRDVFEKKLINPKNVINNLNSNFRSIDNLHLNTNPKIFKSSSSLVYKQWQKILDIYSVNDIYSENFYLLQEKAIKCLERMQTKIKNIKNLMYELSISEFTDSNSLFDIITEKFKDQTNLEAISFILENQSSQLTKEYFRKDFIEFKSATNEIFNLILSIKNDPKLKIYWKSLLNNMAEDYIDYYSVRNTKKINEDNKIINLLDYKNIENVNHHIKLSKSQKYEECISFLNGQIIFKDNNGNYLKPNSKKEAHSMYKTFSECMISYELRKNPTLSKIILDRFKEENNIEESLLLIEIIKENQTILKNIGFIFDNRLSIEGMTDSIYSCVKDFKINQLSNSILSNKYKHLLSVKCKPIFTSMFESNFTHSEIQEFVGRKIASCKNQDDFYTYLESIHKSIFNFGIEKLTSDMKSSTNAKTIINEDGLYVLKIDNFNDSKLLGTSNWCISRSLNYFENYAEGNHQYFIYDFSKEDTDVMSLIGITLYSNGLLNAAHNKIDNDIKHDDKILNLIDKIIVADFSNLVDIELHPRYKEILNLTSQQNKKENKFSIG